MGALLGAPDPSRLVVSPVEILAGVAVLGPHVVGLVGREGHHHQDVGRTGGLPHHERGAADVSVLRGEHRLVQARTPVGRDAQAPGDGPVTRDDPGRRIGRGHGTAPALELGTGRPQPRALAAVVAQAEHRDAVALLRVHRHMEVDHLALAHRSGRGIPLDLPLPVTGCLRMTNGVREPCAGARQGVVLRHAPSGSRHEHVMGGINSHAHSGGSDSQQRQHSTA